MTVLKESSQRGFRRFGSVPILIVLFVGVVIGYRLSSAVHGSRSQMVGTSQAGTMADESEPAWTCSMHPHLRLPEAGECPLCGMDLIPVPAASTGTKKSGNSKSPLYACSMFCLPPQPNPGKCMICGMDMVAVDVDDGDDETASPRSLTLSAYAQKLAEIQTEPVARRFVTAEIRMVGKVDYDETRLGYITAWVPGRLERLYADYTGIPVKKGDHMVYLYSAELYTAQTELLQAIGTGRGNEQRRLAGQPAVARLARRHP